MDDTKSDVKPWIVETIRELEESRGEELLNLDAAERLIERERQWLAEHGLETNGRLERLLDWQCDVLCNLVETDAMLEALDGRERQFKTHPPLKVRADWLAAFKAGNLS